MPQQSEELDVYMKYIFQLGQAIGCVDKKFNKGKKNNISDYITLAQDTLKVLVNLIKNLFNEEREFYPLRSQLLDQIKYLTLP